MHYRPLDPQGNVSSPLAIVFKDGLKRAQVEAMAIAALEQGLNCFVLDYSSLSLNDQIPGALDRALGLSDALAHVQRSIVQLIVKIPQNPQVGWTLVAQLAQDPQIRYLDILSLPTDLYAHHLEVQRSVHLLRGASHVRLVSCYEHPLDLYSDDYQHRDQRVVQLNALVKSRLIQHMILPFSIVSGWRVRRLITESAQQGVAISVEDSVPESLMTQADADQKATNPGFWSRLFSKAEASPLSGTGTYAFLHQTPGWSAESLCVSLVLQEPGITNLMTTPRSMAHLNALSQASCQELPLGVQAQFEMARASLG